MLMNVSQMFVKDFFFNSVYWYSGSEYIKHNRMNYPLFLNIAGFHLFFHNGIYCMGSNVFEVKVKIWSCVLLLTVLNKQVKNSLFLWMPTEN